jgi:hypothetical protein
LVKGLPLAYSLSPVILSDQPCTLAQMITLKSNCSIQPYIRVEAWDA